MIYGATIASSGGAVVLPSHCLFQWLGKINCPACGLSAALMHLAAGHVAAAVSDNLAAVPLVVLLSLATAKGFYETALLDKSFRWISNVVTIAFAVQFLLQFPLAHLGFSPG